MRTPASNSRLLENTNILRVMPALRDPLVIDILIHIITVDRNLKLKDY
jgi:hypothetical protein